MAKSDKLVKAHQLIGNLTQTLTELVDLIFNEEDYEQPKKKRRDPNAPKPPASNYFLFTNSIREKIDKAHPTASFAEKSKIYGLEWQKLTEEQKKPFNEAAKKERERYYKEITAYEAEHGALHPEKRVKAEPKPVVANTKPKAQKIEAKKVTPKATAGKKPAAVQDTSSSSSEESAEESSDSDSD